MNALHWLLLDIAWVVVAWLFIGFVRAGSKGDCDDE